MFGYVRPDTPYLYVKDQTLHQAMYCGVCKGIGKSCGQLARFGLSYDVAFLSAILHNLLGQDVTINRQHCLTHCIRVREMAEVDELTKELGALNVELAYYKCVDDVLDGDKGSAKKLIFLRGHKRAQKQYPAMCNIVREYMQAQGKTEQDKTDSIDRAADASATMLARISDHFLQEKRTEESYALFYNLGKWVYLIDALDDYDKDLKKQSYNPFRLAYHAESKQALIAQQGEELNFIFGTLFTDIRERLERLTMGFNRDLVNNVLLRGLPMQTKKVLQAETCKKCKKRKKK